MHCPSEREWSGWGIIVSRVCHCVCSNIGIGGGVVFRASDCVGGNRGIGCDSVVGGWCVGCICVDSNVVVGIGDSVAVSDWCAGCVGGGVVMEWANGARYVGGVVVFLDVRGVARSGVVGCEGYGVVCVGGDVINWWCDSCDDVVGG